MFSAHCWSKISIKNSKCKAKFHQLSIVQLAIAESSSISQSQKGKKKRKLQKRKQNLEMRYKEGPSLRACFRASRRRCDRRRGEDLWSVARRRQGCVASTWRVPSSSSQQANALQHTLCFTLSLQAKHSN